MSHILTIDWDSPAAKVDEVFALNVGDCFRCTKDIVSIQLKIQERLPLQIPLIITTFEVIVVTPGTTLYTTYGVNTLVVTKKLP